MVAQRKEVFVKMRITLPPHPLWLVGILCGHVAFFTVAPILPILLTSGYNRHHPLHSAIPMFMPFLMLGFLVSEIALSNVFLFRLWKLAQLSNLPIKKPTPGEAIVMSFIPFFNLYWLFILYRNLALHLNSLTQHKISVGLVGSGVILAVSIVLSPIGGIILLIMNFSFYKSARELCLEPVRT